VLVDEYQDTNRLQAQVLLALKPSGAGVTVVGDDAQAIYSFRAATVDNILDFPQQYTPPASVVALERNYRSTQPILDVANALMSASTRQFCKQLEACRPVARSRIYVTVLDDQAQAQYVVDRVLEARERGVELRRQAVLFRAADHSDVLELELMRRNIPFVKYGGLKFLEAAHIKDLLALLRWADNPATALRLSACCSCCRAWGRRIRRGSATRSQRAAIAGWRCRRRRSPLPRATRGRR
jgi:DNA helicase-2/ATP-dependent DNA helicase PcrA